MRGVNLENYPHCPKAITQVSYSTFLHKTLKII